MPKTGQPVEEERAGFDRKPQKRRKTFYSAAERLPAMKTSPGKTTQGETILKTPLLKKTYMGGLFMEKLLWTNPFLKSPAWMVPAGERRAGDLIRSMRVCS